MASSLDRTLAMQLKLDFTTGAEGEEGEVTPTCRKRATRRRAPQRRPQHRPPRSVTRSASTPVEQHRPQCSAADSATRSFPRRVAFLLKGVGRAAGGNLEEPNRTAFLTTVAAAFAQALDVRAPAAGAGAAKNCACVSRRAPAVRACSGI